MHRVVQAPRVVRKPLAQVQDVQRLLTDVPEWDTRTTNKCTRVHTTKITTKGDAKYMLLTDVPEGDTRTRNKCTRVHATKITTKGEAKYMTTHRS